MGSEVYKTTCFEENVFSSWRAIGEAENLSTDSDIAKFMVALYNRNKGKEHGDSGLKCSHCHSPLAYFCTSCSMGHLPSLALDKTAAHNITEDGSPETLTLQPPLSSQEPTVVRSGDTQLLQGGSVLQGAVELATPAKPTLKTFLIKKRAIAAQPDCSFTEDSSDLTTFHQEVELFLELEAKGTLMRGMKDSAGRGGTGAFIGNDDKRLNEAGDGKMQVLAEATNVLDMSEPEDTCLLMEVEDHIKSEPETSKFFECGPAFHDSVQKRSQANSTARRRSRVKKGRVDEHDSSFEGEEKKKSKTTRAKWSPRKRTKKGSSGTKSVRNSSRLQVPKEFQGDKELMVSLTKWDATGKKSQKGRDKISDDGQQDSYLSQESTDGEFLKTESTSDDARETGSSSDLKEPAPKEEPFACRKCNRTYPNRSSFLNHVKCMHPEMGTFFECDLCTQRFAFEKNLDRHKRNEHPEGGCLQCKVCSFQCEFYFDMKAHKKKTHYKLSERKSSKTTDGQSFPCPKCGKVYLLRSTLLTHMKLSHVECDRFFECNLCYLRYSSERTLARHMRKEHPQHANLQCKLCDFQCKFDKDMRNHMKLHHYNRRKLPCEFCGVYMSPNSLRVHVRVHKGEKPFHCSHCGLNFRSLAQLNVHKKAYHSGIDRPFRCHQCGKGFVKNETLRDHMYSHTGEKPFQCPHCSSKFARKDYLSKHLLTHTGERPIKCDICGRRFAVTSGLNSHMKSVHGVSKQDQQKGALPSDDSVPVQVNSPGDAQDVLNLTTTFLVPLNLK